VIISSESLKLHSESAHIDSFLRYGFKKTSMDDLTAPSGKRAVISSCPPIASMWLRRWDDQNSIGDDNAR